MKHISYILNLFFILIITILLLYPHNNENTTVKNDKLMGIMLETENGNYLKSQNSSWPSNREYHLNKYLSNCENGGKISFQNEKVSVNVASSDKCYVYFDNNKTVQDLSGNNNDGVVNAAKWDDSGITTTDDSHYGYVDCGLVNTDFSKGITLIARVKVNEPSTTQSLSVLGFWYNHSNGGGGIYTRTHNDFCMDLYSMGPNQDQTATVCSNTIFAKDVWYTVIGTYNNATLSIYILTDKLIDKATITTNGNIINNAMPIYLGARYSPSGVIHNGFNSYKYALIYNRGIDESEVLDFTTEANPQNKDNLLVWYNF